MLLRRKNAGRKAAEVLEFLYENTSIDVMIFFVQIFSISHQPITLSFSLSLSLSLSHSLSLFCYFFLRFTDILGEYG